MTWDHEHIYSIKEILEYAKLNNICDKRGYVWSEEQPLYKLMKQMCEDMHMHNNEHAKNVYEELIANPSKYPQLVEKITYKHYRCYTFVSGALDE